ncbi:peptide methionine sulfoxide reductase [Aquimarina sp. AD10]|uniref:Peptide methionine sulfoxide reductase n=1 Tax=Aquimarina aggregata TaxID=1642818 RepID=A0A163A219_9FLAO|nr:MULTISPECIES: peptide methionine sulfoxide reductase [Aquimarina]AXT58962.1 peptide methionine sulfoxide reductase [Aquimarina sp. AD10]KZS40205.1 peptide methionine sulfoxide reductase [Aquimarina aggregata]RKM99562.1 peptide methionine sulfoxide reductase [Aquimarina sp. AD10]
MARKLVYKIIHLLPEGYSEAMFDGKRYGITKSSFNNSNSLKIYGEELGGNNFISLNYYRTISKEMLKPCEMPEEKVIHFLENMEVISQFNKK